MGLVLEIVISTQGAQAQTVSWEALSITGVKSRYKAFYQTTPLWELGSLTIEGGIGATAWRWRKCVLRYVTGECARYKWKRDTLPSLLTRARLPLFAEPIVNVYGTSWLSVTIKHRGELIPKFRRVDLFTALGIEFYLSPSLSIHGGLGSPIGWKHLHTTIGLGFSWQFGKL